MPSLSLRVDNDDSVLLRELSRLTLGEISPNGDRVNRRRGNIDWHDSTPPTVSLKIVSLPLISPGGETLMGAHGFRLN